MQKKRLLKVETGSRDAGRKLPIELLLGHMNPLASEKLKVIISQKEAISLRQTSSAGRATGNLQSYQRIEHVVFHPPSSLRPGNLLAYGYKLLFYRLFINMVNRKNLSYCYFSKITISFCKGNYDYYKL